MESLIAKGAKGLVAGPKNLILRRMARLKPKWLVFMASEICNSHCTQCNIWKNKKTHEPLSPEEIRKTLSDPLFSEVLYINNTGGEITTRTDLKEVIMAEHEALPKATISLSTNAILPQRAYDAAKYALEQGITVHVGVSLDGIGEKHDKVRGTEGNFESADWLLRQLLELKKTYGNKLWIVVGSVLMDETLPNLGEIRSYLKDKDVCHEVQCYNSASFFNNLDSTSKETQIAEIEKVVKSLPPRLMNDMWLRWIRGKPIKFTCFAMHSFCVLKSNGDIVPCLNLWDAKAGNVREASPSEIWRSAMAKEARKAVNACPGCVCSFGTNWSFASSFYPFMFYYLKHPGALKSLPRSS